MKSIDFHAETQYRLAVILLDSLLQADYINESDYDACRTELARNFNAPIGLLESEDKLWKNEK